MINVNSILHKENRIPSILVMNSMIFFLLFIFDYTRKESFGDRKSIGTISYLKNRVLRKFDSSVVWNSLEVKSPVSNKDTIKTGASSDVVIRLTDGTEIHADENTLLVLDYSGFKPVLDFSEGSIKIQKSKDQSLFSSNLTIKSNDKKIEIGKSDIKIEKAKNEPLSVFVEKGSAKITQDGKTESIESGTKANFKGKGFDIQKNVIDLKTPSDQFKISPLTQTANVDFAWKKSANSESKIEVSKHSSFSSLVYEMPTTENQMKIPLQEGTYYWRVSILDEKTRKRNYSETRKIVIDSDKLIEPFSPTNDSNLTVSDTSSGVNFHWKEKNYKEGYFIAISQSPDFKGNVTSYESETNNFTLPSLPPGKYYWKVLPKSSRPTVETPGKIYQFNVESKSESKPPKLNQPSNDSMFSKSESGNLFFDWDPNGFKAGEFQFQVGKDNAFKEIIVNRKLDETSYLMQENISPGKYYWRVKSIGRDGKQSGYSKSFKFEIAAIEKRKIAKALVKKAKDEAEPEKIERDRYSPSRRREKESHKQQDKRIEKEERDFQEFLKL
ncbi:MAG: FecR domain-containing protein [Leptospiraceae bacterium]|nr:FecR domain-containing protein [Leptospiraceae bacterium]